MPSQMMDPHSLSPRSFFSEELCFHNEKPVSCWKSDSLLPNYHGMKTDDAFRGGGTSSPHVNQFSISSQMAKGFDLPDSGISEDQKVNSIIQKHAIGPQKVASYSLPRTLNSDLGTRSILNSEPAFYSLEGDKVKSMGTQHENGLFSSSLSDLFTKNPPSHYEDEEPFESLEELEAQTIGNLLPDDDELLSGVTDGIDCAHQPADDTEDLDLFSSVGGMDLGEDGSHRIGGIPSSIAMKLPGGSSCTNHMDKTFNHGILMNGGNSNSHFRGTPNHHPHSLPKYHDGGLTNLTPSNSPGGIASPNRMDTRQFCRLGSNGHSADLNESVFGPSGNGGNPYVWSSSPQRQTQRVIWPNSPSFLSGFSAARPPHGVPVNHHLHVGSAPSLNPSLWDRRRAYAGESPDAPVFHPGSVGSLHISCNSPQPSLEFVPPHHNIFPKTVVGLHSPHQRCMMFPSRGQMIPMMNTFDSPNGRARCRRSEGTLSQTDNKKQFELDIDRIVRGEDKRTTLMLKNIPNKYTSKMLLAAIDERHKGSYDFIYLPIDFKNKCNVGYAFINMTDPSMIIPFHHSFNGKKWEKFNSEKVASLAYARIQGKAALIAHFQNSSLMNEDKRCRPILFHTDGPNAGDQVPFPMGVNGRSRPNKGRTGMSEELDSDPSSISPKESSL